MKRLGRWVLLPVVLLLAGACATGRKAPVVGADALLVTVVNNLAPRTSLTVRITADPGTRMLLGSVSPGATRTFRLNPLMPSGDYQLVAETAEGREIVSREFNVLPGDEVMWSVRTNTVDVGR